MAFIYDLTDTWNNAGTSFSGIKLNVTDTASAITSKLVDLQIGGVSKFSVSKTGAVTATGIVESTVGGFKFPDGTIQTSRATGTVTSVTGEGTVSGLTLAGSITTSGSLTLGGTLVLTSGQVTDALGFTPYNATNPSGYITASALTPYLTSAAAATTYQPLDGDLTAIAALAGAAGLVRKTAANTYALDTAVYITGITSGDVTTALGFTPYNAANPAGYTSNTGTVTSVNLTAGTGVSVSGGPITSSGAITVTNTAPDRIVSITGAGTTSVTGTYPNFTITSNDSAVGTVTSVGITAGAGVSVSGGPITSSGSITVTNTAPDQVVSLTAGSNVTITGTYPNFTIAASGGGSGTVTSVAASGGTTGLTFTGSPITTSGTLTLGGTLAIANGGTNLTSYTTGDLLYASATNTLAKLPIGASGTVLTSNGTTLSWQAGGGGGGGGGSGVSSFRTSMSGLTPSTATTGDVVLAGTLGLANGGTGAATKAAAFNALSPITATGDLIIGNGSNSNTRLPIGSFGRYLYSNGSTASWQPISVDASNVTGVLQAYQGGTGAGSTPSNGQLLIGNGGGYSVANLTAGANITITNSFGGITIAASGGGGGGPYIEKVQIIDNTVPRIVSNVPPGGTQYSPVVWYDPVTYQASFWMFTPSYYGPIEGYYVDQLTITDSDGIAINFYSGMDYNFAGTYYANGYVGGVYGLSISNPTLRSLMENTAAQLGSPAMAPNGSSLYSSHANVEVGVSGGMMSSYFSYPYPIAVTKLYAGAYRVYFRTGNFSGDYGLTINSFSINTSSSNNTFFSGSDFSAYSGGNDSYGFFTLEFYSVSNPTLQELLDNSFISDAP